MSNDPNQYPEDSFDNMKLFAKENNFNFPYLYDEDQSVAKKYKAVCTPDFLDTTQILSFNIEEEYMQRDQLN